MANKRLAVFVQLQGDDGRTHTFGPDTPIPGWARGRIDPAAFSSEDEALVNAAAGPESDEVPVPETPAPLGPSRSAPKDEWVAFAIDQGAVSYEVSAMTKDELVAKYGGPEPEKKPADPPRRTSKKA